MNIKEDIANYRAEIAMYRAMADFLDEDFDFSEATQKEYNALAAEAIAAGFRKA